MSVQYKCYLCGNDSSVIQDSVEFGVPVHRCDSCSLIQTQSLPEAFLEGTYLEAYSAQRKTHVSDEYLEFAKQRGVDQRAFIERETGVKQFSKVLDFGGGFGGALAAFPECERHIFELDVAAREYLETLENVHIHGKELFDDNSHAGQFDLIILSHVLEHMRDPLFELERLQNLLKPEGILFIEVPTEDETVLRLQLQQMKPGLGHVFHFEKKTLRQMMQKARGFELAGLAQCGISKVPFYEGRKKMAFGVENSIDGIWLRAVMKRRVRPVIPKPKARDSALSPEVAQLLFSSRRRELAMLSAMRKSYKELAGVVQENVPAAESVIGLEQEEFNKLFFMSEKARRALEGQQKLVGETLGETRALEKAVDGERQALKEAITSNKAWAEAQLAESKALMDARLAQEHDRATRLEAQIASLVQESTDIRRLNTELIEKAAAASHQNSELAAEKSKAESVAADLKRQNEELSKKLSLLEEEQSALATERDALKDGLASAEESAATLETERDALKEDLASAEMKVATLEPEIAALEKQVERLEEANRDARSNVAKLQIKVRNQVKILRAELERERSKSRSLMDEVDVRTSVYEQKIDAHYAENYEKLERTYARKLEDVAADYENRLKRLADEYNAQAKSTASAFNQAMSEANAKIRRLANEQRALFNVIGMIEASSTYRVGSALTFPVRKLKNGSAAFVQPLVDLPTENDFDRRSAPVALPAEVVTVDAKIVSQPSKPESASNNAPQNALAKPAIVRNKAQLAEAEKQEHARRLESQTRGLGSFYEENGFAIVRNLLTEQEARAKATQFKSDLIRGPISENGHTTFDVASVYPPAQDMVFDPRILSVMRTCLGDDIRFLQWATYQANHMSFPWHRDGAYRLFNVGHDWDEEDHAYRVAKIIIYLECDDFSMGIYPRSHREDIDRTKITKSIEGFDFVDTERQRPGIRLPNKPHLAGVKPGDALIFDQRLFHCGRLTNSTAGDFTKEMKSDKCFLSLLYGADNPHSYRFYSYFNHERQFGIRPMQKRFVNRLKDAGLFLSIGQANYFDLHPEQREGLWLPEDKRAHVDAEGK
ncbi:MULTISPECIES: methyltransferase domain-containing protein [Henriciella]|jgi:SAM-dependent methyltransferase|uniref:methyltransferase domain-containing protein n=1 Tax=Henriciella TaxID=453849 RepID=UPI003517E977